MAKEKVIREKEDWMQKKWRPMMAVMYMIVCIFDFIIFPVMFTVVQFWETQASNDAFRQWQPITLVGAGLFHMAMGAVLGITAWSRGQEKIAGVAANVGVQNGYNVSSNGPSTFGIPASSGFGSSSNSGYATASTNYGSYGSTNYSGFEVTRETMSIEPVRSGGTFTSRTGKQGPVQPDMPEI